jgi:hypothetical protein
VVLNAGSIFLYMLPPPSMDDVPHETHMDVGLPKRCCGTSLAINAVVGTSYKTKKYGFDPVNSIILINIQRSAC